MATSSPRDVPPFRPSRMSRDLLTRPSRVSRDMTSRDPARGDHRQSRGDVSHRQSRGDVSHRQSRGDVSHRQSRDERKVSHGPGEDPTRPLGISQRHYSTGWQLLRAARQASLGFMSLCHKGRPKIQYENTYQITPKTVFNVSTVENIIQDVLHKNLEFSVYNPLSMKIECKSLSQAILSKVKALGWERYKYVCYVHILSMRAAACVGSRMLSNHETDNYASYTFTNGRLTAIGTVYGAYLD